MNTFAVQRIRSSDVDDFREIRLEALRLHPDAFGASFADESQKHPEFFAERLQSNAVFGGFDRKSRLQGIIGISVNPAPKLCHVATLWGMYVRADMSGTGLSLALLRAALLEAGAGMIVKLSVVATNPSAQRLYRSVGFTPWATDCRALCIDGVFHDVLLMRRDPH